MLKGKRYLTGSVLTNEHRTAPQRPPRVRRRKYESLSTAIHEAGHAVLAALLGIPIIRATIVPDRISGTDGSVFHAGGFPLWQRAIVIVGGYAAQRIRDPRPEESWLLGCFDDFDKLHSMFKGDYSEKYIIDRATKILNTHSVALDRVVRALLEKKTLTGEEVLELVPALERAAA